MSGDGVEGQLGYVFSALTFGQKSLRSKLNKLTKYYWEKTGVNWVSLIQQSKIRNAPKSDFLSTEMINFFFNFEAKKILDF